MSDDVRDVFVGTGAFIGTIQSDTKCSFWPTDPRHETIHYADAKLIELDLAMSNNAVVLGSVAGEIQYDAGKTTLGPAWPRGPDFVARVYLYAGYIAKLPAERRPPNPPVDASGRDYEFQLIVYKAGSTDPHAGRRYQGVYAEVVSRVGNRAELDVFEPGRSLAIDAERKRLSVDLASTDVCDPVDPREPTIGSDPAVKKGQVFIAENRLFEIFRSYPKLPPFLGTLRQ